MDRTPPGIPPQSIYALAYCTILIPKTGASDYLRWKRSEFTVKAKFLHRSYHHHSQPDYMFPHHCCKHNQTTTTSIVNTMDCPGILFTEDLMELGGQARGRKRTKRRRYWGKKKERQEKTTKKDEKQTPEQEKEQETRKSTEKKEHDGKKHQKKHVD
ncbi:uncharacterized protein BO95DRAFT_431512 [Aspergillus brunneoviolaceus CBS 621.78]|uniref:Uncharacterized protein n=1 Tax=Aspergillus brunneoviolaceus CBS 621.78 TaxID=1450534 RepID=A0ACD1GAE9_9EURO|nr:hypothetical protein BO95DRAFT_431512 [Aspergillus brunneoviolaceus CBS 621.78]RAH46259.1 hypothetical protein BO95DRAFT_431512 [Aspergillus brunneoviolaceus CBS 621.78]